MKVPIYETSGGALAALLATRAFVFADLYTFTTANGGPVLRYTAADLDIGHSSLLWTHGGPLFDKESAPTAHWKTGLDVDTWSVTLLPRLTHPITGAATPDQIAGQPWLQAVRGGALDGAVVTVDRAYLAAWPTGANTFSRPAPPVGVINIFTGRVASCDVTRTTATISINSHLELLGVTFPRNVFQAPCRHTLFNQGCTLVAASFAVTGSVASGSTQRVIRANIAAPPGSGTYALGRIVMTSGANNTFSRSIRAFLSGLPAQLTLIAPFSFPIQVGDTFTAYAGCDKTQSTCSLFGNKANFLGTPFIPEPELGI